MFRSIMDRPVPNMVARFIVVMAGMAFVAFGIALSRQTLLGSSPISAVPTVLSFAFPELTVGTWTFIINLIFLAMQIALLRKRFSPVQLLQIPLLIVFSATIDFWVGIVCTWDYSSYLLCLVWILVGCASVALGVYLQTQMQLIMLPGDAVVTCVSSVFKLPFASCKIGFDVAQMVISAAISLICNGYLYGVREGTLIAAIVVGPMIKGWSLIMGGLERFIPCEGHATFLPKADEI